MQNETTYRKIEETITDYFTEEAAPLLPPAEIDETLSEEQARISRAETAGIPCRFWMGTNLQRYSKELLRRRQPFYAGYILLGFCTEVSCALLIIYALQWLLLQFTTSPQIKTYFPVIPPLLTGYFLWSYVSQAHARRKLSHTQLPPEAVADKLTSFRIISGAIVLIGIAAMLSLFWDSIAAVLMPLTISHVFFVYVTLIILSGIHNVLYDSQCIPFLSIGFFSLHKRFSAEKGHAIEWYMAHKKTGFLASRKRTAQEFDTDAAMQTEYRLSLRSHLITYRIYILLALFILIILDGLCIYQTIKAFTVPVLILGLVSVFLSILFIAAFRSCLTLLHHIRKLS